MNDWIGLQEDYLDYQGFVYKITNLETEQYYIGKKFFHRKKTLKPLKGRKNKRHSIVESDWKAYCGSSNNLSNAIEEYGISGFRREILHHCKTKFDCAYMELKEQLKHDVLFDKQAYNEIINIRLRKRKL